MTNYVASGLVSCFYININININLNSDNENKKYLRSKVERPPDKKKWWILKKSLIQHFVLFILQFSIYVSLADFENEHRMEFGMPSIS